MAGIKNFIKFDDDDAKNRRHQYAIVLDFAAGLRDHPYITSAKRVGGWIQKMANFADVQYCIYAYKVGGWGPKRPKIC